VGEDEPALTAAGTEIVTRQAAGELDGHEPLREQLPGIEADRNLTDWGQSQRVTALADATVMRFLFDYWNRVEVEGIEWIPRTGGALLVANRAGQLRLDAGLIAKAVAQGSGGGSQSGRHLQVATSRTYSEVPGLGMVVTKLGGVLAHPANLQRLLFDEQALVLVFPEGDGASSKPLRWRYRLRKFERIELLQAAMRARVPIIPVAVVGSEEAMPTFASLSALKLPLIGSVRLGLPLPLPAKVRLRFLKPISTGDLGEAPWRDRTLAHELAEEIRGLLQENLFEMVAARRSVWLG
jgi:1-acyl-sn-glycerol-3-phosphate acyltransferase